MSDVPTCPRPGAFRHYKGGRYVVLLTARHSETEEWLVIYRAESDGSLWVRPLSMWNETVLVGKIWMKRFTAITNDQDATASILATR